MFSNDAIYCFRDISRYKTLIPDLKVVVELAQRLEVLLLLVEVSQNLSSDINLLVNVSILKQLQPYKMKAVVRKYSQHKYELDEFPA